MKYLKKIFILLSIFLILILPSVAYQDNQKQETAPQEGVKILIPTEIIWNDAPTLPKGAKIAILRGDPSKNGPFTMRAKFPANYILPPHFHPMDEHLTVISGIYNVGLGEKFDRKISQKLPSGSFVVMPAGATHFAWTSKETIIQVHSIGPWGITFVNSEDDP